MLPVLQLLSCATPLPPVANAEECEDEVAPTTPIATGPDGRELFLRSWVPEDPRAGFRGDGLGPIYNDVSCGACHSLGGPGGAGGRDHNVNLIPSRRATIVRHAFGEGLPFDERMLLSTGGFLDFDIFQRNTPALFGDGLIDAVPDDVLVEAASYSWEDFPEVSGRVARDADGRIGRFGWKGQVPSLAAFVSKACANELGLDVPEEAQPGPAPEGWDLDEEEVAALTSFVAGLPAPEQLSEGSHLFGDTGCATCHQPILGDIAGIYSDLLLHDLGPDLADSGSGYGISSVRAIAKDPGEGPAASGEWRTPPLWGLRDSGPWLHDGRATSLDQAILLHDGEARAARKRYQALSESERWQLQAFLRTLVAPGSS